MLCGELEEIKKMKKKFHQWKLSQGQTIGIGFLLIILIGSLLLMLPMCHKPQQSPSYLDCLFTSVSATCVTGLVTVDTYQTWSKTGQAVILMMIQIGGLGFVTMGVFLAVVLRSRIGLRQRSLMQESISAGHIGGIVRLAKRIVKGTALIEGTGAVLLSVYFIPRFGLVKGIGYGVFHSISAFCNAGFDLMGAEEPFSSFAGKNGNPYVLTVLMFLIVIGGIGFAVWDDLYTKRFKPKRWTLHTKIALCGTVILIFGGGLLFWIMEKNRTLSGMSGGEQVVHALFASVTARTAGFNSVEVSDMSDGSILLTIILMVIGGCPGSTAGGIKITTIAVLLLYIKATVLREPGCHAFGRELPEELAGRAMAVIAINLGLVLIGSLLICMIQPLPLKDVLFEVSSAMGTVGMTTGITRQLTTASRCIVMAIMYCGRIGSLSFAFAVFDRKRPTAVRLPKEEIPVG